MIRNIAVALSVPATLYCRAKLFQNGLVRDATAVCPAFLEWLFLPSLGFCGYIMRGMSRMRYQRRQGARLHRPGRFDPGHPVCRPLIHYPGYGRRKARHVFHGVSAKQYSDATLINNLLDAAILSPFLPVVFTSAILLPAIGHL